MPYPENIIPVDKALGATPKEVPEFMLGEWGHYLKSLTDTDGILTQSLTEICEINPSAQVLDLKINLHYALPLEALSFIGKNEREIEILYSPGGNAILIQQSEEERAKS